MNKKIWAIIFLTVLLIFVASVAYAGGPWKVKIEGNGYLFGPFYGGVVKTDIGWNMKYNADSGQVKGQLNIVETLADGSNRHFKLSGYQVYPVGDPTAKPIVIKCNEVRVEGFDDSGRAISAHFRPPSHPIYPNTIWYWVKDSSGAFISNTFARLPLSSTLSMSCAG